MILQTLKIHTKHYIFGDSYGRIVSTWRDGHSFMCTLAVIGPICCFQTEWCALWQEKAPGRAGWRSTTRGTGAPCATTTGPRPTPRWSADSWASGGSTDAGPVPQN